MKRERKVLRKVICLIVLATSLLSVGMTVSAAKKSANPKLSETKVTLTVGKTYSLSIKNVGNKKVNWSTTKKSVASIKKISKTKVKITAKAKGMTYVKANIGKRTYKCKVMVTNPSASKVKKAYDTFVNNTFYNGSYMYPGYDLFDINKDGVKELIVTYMSGVRAGYQMFTYKNGKVIKMHKGDYHGGCGISRVKGTKYICISQSSGAADTSETCYKIKGTKLVKVCHYRFLGDSTGKVQYYKDGKKISKTEYDAFMKKLISIN